MSPQSSDFVDDIVQDELPTHSVPPRDTFRPWHRVRKEFIRRHQWNDLTTRMIKRYWRQQLQRSEDYWPLDKDGGTEVGLELPMDIALERTLKCLVIPGEDLLDVRALWRDVNALRCRIRYLGFNESFGSDQKGTRIHVANNAILALPGISPDSRVLPDRFEAIHSTQSLAYRYLRDYGPYHIVNLDLCGSMFPNTAGATKQYYNALLRLMAYQFENQKSEWLLFITTMVEPAVVHEEDLQTLCKPTRENFKKHSDFADKLKTFLPHAAFRNEEAFLNLQVLNEDQMVQLFGVALGKWLLALCHKARPQWTVAMRKSFRYSVNREKGAVMLSLAFALKPNITPPVDDTGIATLDLPAREYPDERECAVRLAESVCQIQDVDQALDANPELKTRLRDLQADLLQAAGYDRAKYVQWVENGEAVAESG